MEAFEILALPRIERRAGRVTAADPTRSLPALWDERRRLLLDAVERLRPDVLLVDQFPFFKWELRPEIVPLIERLRAACPGARVVCSTWELPRGAGPEPRAPSPEQVKRTFREHFDGLLVHYAAARGATLLMRGIRAVSDYEYELQMALMNRRLNPNIETVFLMAGESYSFLSSRLVKEVIRLGGDVSAMVPPNVEERLRARLLGAAPVNR